MTALDYPITRPYPWKRTTITVCFCGGLVLIGLGLINFTAIGYNSQSLYRDDFQYSTNIGWRNKLNIEYTQNHSIKCEPNNIILGGVYRTNNAIFALNVESLRDPITTAPLGSANYSADVLDSCRVNRIYMMAKFATHEAHYRAQVACRSPTLFANFTLESVVTPRSGVPNSIVNVNTIGTLEQERSRPEAVATSILHALGIDVLASIFFITPPVPASALITNASASSLWAEWDALAPTPDPQMVLSGLAAPDGSYFQSRDGRAFQDLTPTARRAIQNYVIGLHSAILVDVGSTVALAAGQPDSNILTNLTALRERIQTSELLETMMTPTNGSANGVNFKAPAATFVLSHTSEFKLPISARRLVGNTDRSGSGGDPGPATLVQRYLCYSLVLKPTPTLVVDVLVATVSMFLIAWKLVQIVLVYVAKERTINGNHCSCPTCDPYRHAPVPVTTLGEKDPWATEYIWRPYSPGNDYQ